MEGSQNKYKGHEVTFAGVSGENVVFYVDTTLVTLPNFSALDMYIMNLNTQMQKDICVTEELTKEESIKQDCENGHHKYERYKHECMYCGKHDGYSRSCGSNYCKCLD